MLSQLSGFIKESTTVVSTLTYAYQNVPTTRTRLKSEVQTFFNPRHTLLDSLSL